MPKDIVFNWLELYFYVRMLRYRCYNFGFPPCRCIIDLSQLEKERTHDIWQDLECGYGSVHLLVTVSGSLRALHLDSIPTTNGLHKQMPVEDKFVSIRKTKT